MNESYFVTLKMVGEEVKYYKDANVGMLNENDGLFAVLNADNVPLLILPVGRLEWCKLDDVSEMNH